MQAPLCCSSRDLWRWGDPTELVKSEGRSRLVIPALTRHWTLAAQAPYQLTIVTNFMISRRGVSPCFLALGGCLVAQNVRAN